MIEEHEEISEKKIVKTFKVTSAELDEITFKAGKYAKGNFSDWIRKAAINYKPEDSSYGKRD